MNSPSWHYEQAMTLQDEIVKRKDDEKFVNESAMLLTACAQTHLLAGILSHLEYHAPFSG
jgi:hypothetical protein